MLGRRDGRFDRKRVSYTLRIEPFVATQTGNAFTDSQHEAGEKCGLRACLRISPSPMVAEFANLRAMEKKFKEWNPKQA